MGSGGRISTSSQSTPEPDADIGEDFAVCSGDDAALDYGWGEVKENKLSLAAAENRIRALEKLLQTERRLRKEAEVSLMQARAKMPTQAETQRDGRAGTDDDDLLMDVGVQTDKQPEPGREAVEREINAAVTKLQARNDALEIENQMMQADLQGKEEEIAMLRSDNKVLWAEQDAVRIAKDDFKDLQLQLANHVKAGNLVTKRPTSNATRVYAGAHDCAIEESDIFGSVQVKPCNTEDIPSQSSNRAREIDAHQLESAVQKTTQEPESALSNFMGIFQGDIREDSEDDNEPDARFDSSRPFSDRLHPVSTAQKCVQVSFLAFCGLRVLIVALVQVVNNESSASRLGVADHAMRHSEESISVMPDDRPWRPSTGRTATGEKSKPSVAEYRRSVSFLAQGGAHDTSAFSEYFLRAAGGRIAS